MCSLDYRFILVEIKNVLTFSCIDKVPVSTDVVLTLIQRCLDVNNVVTLKRRRVLSGSELFYAGNGGEVSSISMVKVPIIHVE